MLLSMCEILIGASLISLIGMVVCAFVFLGFEVIQSIKDETSKKK